MCARYVPPRRRVCTDQDHQSDGWSVVGDSGITRSSSSDWPSFSDVTALHKLREHQIVEDLVSLGTSFALEGQDMPNDEASRDANFFLSVAHVEPFFPPGSQDFTKLSGHQAIVAAVAHLTKGLTKGLRTKAVVKSKLAALDILDRNANHGDADTVAALIASLSDFDLRVRRASVNVLSRKAKHGDDDAVSALISNLHDSDEHVRNASAYALGKVANGDAMCVSALVASLQHCTSPDVIEHDVNPAVATLRSLAYVAHANDDGAIAAVTDCLHVPVQKLRVVALEVLVLLARPEQINDAALSFLKLEDLAERDALVQLGMPHYTRTIAALISGFSNRDEIVRQLSAEALGNLAEKDNERAISALANRMHNRTIDLESSDGKVFEAANVLKAALRAIAKVAKKGNRSAIFAVVKCLHQPEGDVQMAALETIEVLAHQGDELAGTLMANLLHLVCLCYPEDVNKKARALILQLARNYNDEVSAAVAELADCGVISVQTKEKVSDMLSMLGVDGATRELALQSMSGNQKKIDKISLVRIGRLQVGLVHPAVRGLTSGLRLAQGVEKRTNQTRRGKHFQPINEMEAGSLPTSAGTPPHWIRETL